MSESLNETRSSNDPGRDGELARALAAFDPARLDPNYWVRFRSWVMSGAAQELARRRLIARLTVGDVVESWARAVVPTAVLAAVLAGLLLIRGGVPTGPMQISVEELLVAEIEGETIPVMLDADETSGVVTFASEIF